MRAAVRPHGGTRRALSAVSSAGREAQHGATPSRPSHLPESHLRMPSRWGSGAAAVPAEPGGRVRLTNRCAQNLLMERAAGTCSVKGMNAYVCTVRKAHSLSIQENDGSSWEVGGRGSQQSPGKSPSSRQQGPGAGREGPEQAAGMGGCGARAVGRPRLAEPQSLHGVQSGMQRWTQRGTQRGTRWGSDQGTRRGSHLGMWRGHRGGRRGGRIKGHGGGYI